VQKRLGIPSPMFGRLIEGRIATSPARLDPSRFFNILVETEFSFRMARALPALRGPYDLAQVSDAVGALIPSIELADTRRRLAEDRAARRRSTTVSARLGRGAACIDFRARPGRARPSRS
jgi:2-keto-4-pentenoate hydratase